MLRNVNSRRLSEEKPGNCRLRKATVWMTPFELARDASQADPF
jgi:hypothetical protein